MKCKVFVAEIKKNPFSNHMTDKLKMDEAHEPSWWTRWAERKNQNITIY